MIIYEYLYVNNFQELSLQSLDSFKILAEGNCTRISGGDDAQEFQALCTALSTLNCSEQEMSSIWAILACILHLGNVRYAPGLGYVDASDNLYTFILFFYTFVLLFYTFVLLFYTFVLLFYFFYTCILIFVYLRLYSMFLYE